MKSAIHASVSKETIDWLNGEKKNYRNLSHLVETAILFFKEHVRKRRSSFIGKRS